MTPKALWRLTPREFEALSDRYLSYYRQIDERQKQIDQQWAIMASMFWNVHRDKDSRVKTPADFLPGAKVDPGAAERERIERRKEIEIRLMLAQPIKLSEVPQWALARAN